MIYEDNLMGAGGRSDLVYKNTATPIGCYNRYPTYIMLKNVPDITRETLFQNTNG